MSSETRAFNIKVSHAKAKAFLNTDLGHAISMAIRRRLLLSPFRSFNIIVCACKGDENCQAVAEACYGVIDWSSSK